jgi:hypothetical protein
MLTTPNVKGMIKMNKILNKFAYSLVSVYSKFKFHTYTLDINDISEFDLNEFASLLIKNDPSLASEATGSDNPLWETKMLPALRKYLSRSDDKDEEREYLRVWTTSITSYFIPMIQEMLDAQLVEYSFDRKFSTDRYSEAAWL